MSIKNKNTNKNNRTIELHSFYPQTNNQTLTFKNYEKGNHLFLHGIAGTGKTFISMFLGLQDVLRHNKYNTVTIVRNNVFTREMGFLPGSEQEKMAIFEAPYKAICTELFSYKDAYDKLKKDEIINFTSSSAIRGITINNSVVIVDECQNLNFHELDSIITRVGKNTRIIFCGDYTQTDLVRESEKHGILQFLKVISNINTFSVIEFKIEDIVRSDFIKEYIVNKYKLGYHNVK